MPEPVNDEDPDDLQAGVELPPNPTNTEDNDDHEDTVSELSEASLYTEVSEHRGRQSRIIKQLLEMEKVRGVELREGISWPNLARTANREAVLAQAVGHVVEPSCRHCARGEGPFSSCIQVEVDNHPLLKGSCASCHANSTGQRCSLRRK